MEGRGPLVSLQVEWWLVTHKGLAFFTIAKSPNSGTFQSLALGLRLNFFSLFGQFDNKPRRVVGDDWRLSNNERNVGGFFVGERDQNLALVDGAVSLLFIK